MQDLAFEKRKALMSKSRSHQMLQKTASVSKDAFRSLRSCRAVLQRGHATHRREEDDGGPLYNQHQITTWHTPLPPDVKRFVFDELQKTMEAWAPSVGPLKGTSAYGVRTYETGSYLHLHVDTAQTHVVSGILNVAQDLDGGDDWPVEILDHGGKLHAVNMKPRDCCCRGSALITGGRLPSKGGPANVFVHYQPQDGEEDFESRRHRSVYAVL